MARWAAKEKAQDEKAQQFFTKLYTKIYDTVGLEIADAFWGNRGEKYQQYMPDLGTLENETFTNIVVGNEDLDYFDEFVNTWKTTGGDEVTAEVSEWYKANA